MPLFPWSRSKGDVPPFATPAHEVDRLAADPRLHRVLTWFARHERDISDFQLAITAIAAPSFAESARAAFFRDRLTGLGYTTEIDAVGNLLARPAGSDAAEPALTLCAHLDTVFSAATVLDVRRDHARLLGPGISDNGSGLAALWALAAAFAECEIHTLTPLLFIGNVCEEGEGNLRGVRHLYRPATADSAPPAISRLISIDGAGADSIICQALGSRRFELVITGPGGHSWSDFGAPNPITAAALAIEAMTRLPLSTDPRTTLNVGTIEGGTSINSIPERVLFRVDLRSSETARLDELEAHLRRLLVEACTEVNARSSLGRGALHASVTVVGERPAGELAPSSPLLAAVRAVDSHLGIASQIMRASTDANIPLSLGLEALTLGAGGSGGGAHTVHEWFDPAGRQQGLKRLALLILLLAGLPSSGDSAAPHELRPPGGNTLSPESE